MHSLFLRLPLSALVGLTLFASCATAQTFDLEDRFIGNDFYNGFDWQTFDDPTHGRVNYVDMGTAMQQGLAEGERGDHIYECVQDLIFNSSSTRQILHESRLDERRAAGCSRKKQQPYSVV